MLSQDSQGVRPTGVAAQVGLCAVLSLFFALGGERFVGIERSFYDLCQRLSATASAAPVVIVSTDKGAHDLWSLSELDELISTIRAAGAKVIIPASPAPPPVATVDVARLKSLIRIEQHGGTLQNRAEPGLLQRQLEDAEQRISQQQRVSAAVRAAGNVVLGLATTESRPGSDTTSNACAKRISGVSERFADPDNSRAATAALAPASAALCEAAAAVGHITPLTDHDRIVRRVAPMLMTPPGAVPSAALAAVALDADIPKPGGDLVRFYRSAGNGPGFAVVSAADVLSGQAAAALRGRYVIIAPPEAGRTDGVRTPISGHSGAAVLIATDLANYLSDDHIARPGWSRLVEIGLALLLAVSVVLSGRLNLQASAALAVSSMAVLLATEYFLFAVVGLWLQLAGLALFCLTGVALFHFILQLWGRFSRETPNGADTRGGVAAGHVEELDLGFSVLRQQPTTERTKQQLYELAMEHGKKRDYARAERVFRHIAARDPGYRDVAEKLEKLSGARGVAPAPSRPDRAAPALAAAAATVSPAGRTLGRYELERVIGRGAMGTVYLGRDPTINRRVAIKTLPLAEEFVENDLATARSHFLREAESAGRLSHQYIISIYDAGEDDRMAYLAMEYFEGKPLSHYAQLGRLLPPKVVFELMARAAEALHYAHSQNVVHRDVKPANLMYDIANDRLKLTDFGIARLTDASRTRTGIILGTPSYMSPEQLSASKVSGQTDIYSLGVTMYHLLTGAPPFQADSIPRLMDKIVHHKHRPISDIRDDVPSCADVILARALAKNPEDRYESGNAMALALRECCSTFTADTV
jgi:serine/threonine-protein kinase